MCSICVNRPERGLRGRKENPISKKKVLKSIKEKKYENLKKNKYLIKKFL